MFQMHRSPLNRKSNYFKSKSSHSSSPVGCISSPTTLSDRGPVAVAGEGLPEVQAVEQEMAELMCKMLAAETERELVRVRDQSDSSDDEAAYFR